MLGSITIVAAIFVAQIYIYSWAASKPRDQLDSFITTVIFSESLLSLALLVSARPRTRQVR